MAGNTNSTHVMNHTYSQLQNWVQPPVHDSCGAQQQNLARSQIICHEMAPFLGNHERKQPVGCLLGLHFQMQAHTCSTASWPKHTRSRCQDVYIQQCRTTKLTPANSGAARDLSSLQKRVVQQKLSCPFSGLALRISIDLISSPPRVGAISQLHYHIPLAATEVSQFGTQLLFLYTHARPLPFTVVFAHELSSNFKPNTALQPLSNQLLFVPTTDCGFSPSTNSTTQLAVLLQQQLLSLPP